MATDKAVDTTEAQTIPADQADTMKGWTAQMDGLPEPFPHELPQQFVPEQLPDEAEMEKTGLSIPENQKTDDVTMLEPADQVRLGNPDYASPLGITANPEGYHIPNTTPDAGMVSPTPADANAPAAATDLDSMTRAELDAEAAAKGVPTTTAMNKSDVVDAIKAGG